MRIITKEEAILQAYDRALAEVLLLEDDTIGILLSTQEIRSWSHLLGWEIVHRVRSIDCPNVWDDHTCIVFACPISVPEHLKFVAKQAGLPVEGEER